MEGGKEEERERMEDRFFLRHPISGGGEGGRKEGDTFNPPLLDSN